MLKNTNSFAKVLMTSAPRGLSKHITPPLFCLYNSITYRQFNTNRTMFGRFPFAQNGNRNGQNGTQKIYAIKKWTQGVLTRFIPVSFVLLKTFFKKAMQTRNISFSKDVYRTHIRSKNFSSLEGIKRARSVVDTTHWFSALMVERF